MPGTDVHSQRKRDQSSLDFFQLVNHVSQWSPRFWILRFSCFAIRSPIRATRSFRLTRDSHSYDKRLSGLAEQLVSANLSGEFASEGLKSN
jgi:hypothetical protein